MIRRPPRSTLFPSTTLSRSTEPAIEAPVEETESTEPAIEAPTEETESTEPAIEAPAEETEAAISSWESYTLYNYISLDEGKTYISLETQENGITAAKTAPEFHKDNNNLRYDLTEDEYSIADYDLDSLVITVNGISYVNESVAKEGQPSYSVRLDRVESVKGAPYRASSIISPKTEAFTSIGYGVATFHRNWYITLNAPEAQGQKLLTGIQLMNGDKKYYGIDWTESFQAVDSRLIPFTTKLNAGQYSIEDYDFSGLEIEYKGNIYVYRPNGPEVGDHGEFHYYTATLQKIDKLVKSTYAGGYLVDWPDWPLIKSTAGTDGYPYAAGYYHRDYSVYLYTADLEPALVEEPEVPVEETETTEPAIEAPVEETETTEPAIETPAEETDEANEEITKEPEEVIEEAELPLAAPTAEDEAEEEAAIEETEESEVMEEAEFKAEMTEEAAEETEIAVESEAEAADETVEAEEAEEEAEEIEEDMDDSIVPLAALVSAGGNDGNGRDGSVEAIESEESEETKDAALASAEASEAEELETIEENEAPLAAPILLPAATEENSWALMNLILVIVSMISAAFMMIFNTGKSKAKAASAAIAAASFIIFVLTADLSAKVVLTDKWTILLAVLAAASLVIVAIKERKTEEEAPAEFASAAVSASAVIGK
jgi:hypothetical protein